MSRSHEGEGGVGGLCVGEEGEMARAERLLPARCVGKERLLCEAGGLGAVYE